MSEVITNEENILSGESGGMTPVTRKELFLAKLAGMDVQTPTPITREEMFLQMAIEAGGGVSSWNDLTDKPFGETEVTVVMLGEKTYDGFAMHSEFGVYAYESTTPPTFNLTLGQTYTVKWDGVSYACVAQDMSIVAAGAIGLGDLTMSGGIGNDEPFAIGWISGGILFLSKDTETSHTVAISYDDTIVETLDAKFLPEPATSIDLSGFESDGIIVETFADGTTSTTVMEFDADGRPSKITDGNGNVTVLTW